MAADELEVVMVRGDDAGAVGPRSERDKHVEVEVAEFFRGKTASRINRAEKLARLDPILLGGRENTMILCESDEEVAFERSLGE